MKKKPHYAELSKEELKQIEAEFGHPLSGELALWFIRNRMTREAVERMLKAEDSSGIHILGDRQTIDQRVTGKRRGSEGKEAKMGKRQLPRKKCA
jgi:hypothetical protein